MNFQDELIMQFVKTEVCTGVVGQNNPLPCCQGLVLQLAAADQSPQSLVQRHSAQWIKYKKCFERRETICIANIIIVDSSSLGHSMLGQLDNWDVSQETDLA